MSYPMTWQRLLARNGLRPDDHTLDLSVNVSERGLVKSEDEFRHIMAPHWQERLVRYHSQISMLRMDIGRLSYDTCDEGAICRQIEARTGVDADTVAAVLKEWMAI